MIYHKNKVTAKTYSMKTRKCHAKRREKKILNIIHLLCSWWVAQGNIKLNKSVSVYVCLCLYVQTNCRGLKMWWSGRVSYGVRTRSQRIQYKLLSKNDKYDTLLHLKHMHQIIPSHFFFLFLLFPLSLSHSLKLVPNPFICALLSYYLLFFFCNFLSDSFSLCVCVCVIYPLHDSQHTTNSI